MQNIPETYLESTKEEDISVRPVIKQDGAKPAKPVSASERNKTDNQDRVWISMGEEGECEAVK